MEIRRFLVLRLVQFEGSKDGFTGWDCDKKSCFGSLDLCSLFGEGCSGSGALFCSLHGAVGVEALLHSSSVLHIIESRAFTRTDFRCKAPISVQMGILHRFCTEFRCRSAKMDPAQLQLFSIRLVAVRKDGTCFTFYWL